MVYGRIPQPVSQPEAAIAKMACPFALKMITGKTSFAWKCHSGMRVFHTALVQLGRFAHFCMPNAICMTQCQQCADK